MQPVRMTISGLDAGAAGRLRLARIVVALLTVVMVGCTFCWTQETAAQDANSAEMTPSKTGTSAPNTVHKKRQTKAQLKAEAEKKRLTAPIPEPEDPGPTFPADERAKKAEIRWDSSGLKVEADNSSLKEILAEITTETGVTIEGLNTDKRIYGVYGPGRARDVLAQLLYGTGYDILMIGEQGPGTPRQVVLTSHGVMKQSDTPSVSQRAVQPVEDDDVEMPDDPQAGQPLRPGFRTPPRPPQEPQNGAPIQPQSGQPNQPNQLPQQPQPN